MRRHGGEARCTTPHITIHSASSLRIDQHDSAEALDPLQCLLVMLGITLPPHACSEGRGWQMEEVRLSDYSRLLEVVNHVTLPRVPGAFKAFFDDSI